MISPPAVMLVEATATVEGKIKGDEAVEDESEREREEMR